MEQVIKDSGCLAGIDCGTNSTRLLITDSNGNATQRSAVITRLGQGVDSTRRIDESALLRTLEVLKRYRQLMDDFHVGKARLVATSAVRDALNGQAFLDAVMEICGIKAEILSGEEEGLLTFNGAISGYENLSSTPFLVVDVGGGSTELIAGTNEGDVKAVTSLDMGCVRITERFLKHDPPHEKEISQAIDYCEELLMHASAEVLELGVLDSGTILIGVAGTVSTLAQIIQKLSVYERERIHHFVLDYSVLTELERELATKNVEDKQQIIGLEPARADVILGGLIVLIQVMKHFHFERCLASESDILDGLIASLR
ncbi:MAG: Ppx/GppA family phosphatase [Actinobacteria bacterium]|nr:Ppx/GppA family phosphatase [Actinomycetota bacterium]MCL6105278.1 Ppx/GppA family phosphatase [Actinomycetota bacterium]